MIYLLHFRRPIAWKVTRTWPGDRAAERRLKRRKDAPALCPLCAGGATGTGEEGAEGGKRRA